MREPVSAASHGVWLLLSVPAAQRLWRRSAGDRAKQLSLLGYVLCLAFCAAASTLYHAVTVSADRRAPFLLLDHVGIAALIAGTYTPIAWNLLHGRWRWMTLMVAWLLAASGSLLRLRMSTLPIWLSTGLYLGMGWAAVFFYLEFTRTLSCRALAPIIVGGILYSVGALFNLLRWPVLWPGVFEAHELFHLFVVAGSMAHFNFMFRVVAPYNRADVASSRRPARHLTLPGRGQPTAYPDAPDENPTWRGASAGP
ncbi:MAG: hemolysin III family protein [Planctomycetaceae bacterium]|nr:hemolysin III family protein [Planctomycetaceae bacterium]